MLKKREKFAILKDKITSHWLEADTTVERADGLVGFRSLLEARYAPCNLSTTVHERGPAVIINSLDYPKCISNPNMIGDAPEMKTHHSDFDNIRHSLIIDLRGLNPSAVGGMAVLTEQTNELIF
ncbi:hypothetical protein PCASD_21371 [Puccinia coronata f. sp. avenae]|uniref:Uncharacterized protein n=1 Tax=Puccinia coronata f. sp. avenae TaxID=200324 RepID=A0A2N5ST52_9BASI|nr:hypothetical protein PCASD_21371 [Puccinia coronata f. sp. avenae]